jgi:hypothetical protein
VGQVGFVRASAGVVIITPGPFVDNAAQVVI